MRTSSVVINVRRTAGDGLIIAVLGKDGATVREHVVADLGRKTLVVGEKIVTILKESGLCQ